MEQNPISIFFCWQSLVLALVVSGVVQFIKASLDAKMGEEKRKANKFLTRVFLPFLGLFLGALLANAMPIRPDVLIDYIKLHRESWEYPDWGVWSTYAGWGAAVGQFADYAFTKVKSYLAASAEKEEGSR